MCMPTTTLATRMFETSRVCASGGASLTMAVTAALALVVVVVHIFLHTLHLHFPMRLMGPRYCVSSKGVTGPILMPLTFPLVGMEVFSPGVIGMTMAVRPLVDHPSTVVHKMAHLMGCPRVV